MAARQRPHAVDADREVDAEVAEGFGFGDGFGDDVSVGSRVAVEGKGNGVVRFVGLHAENGKPRIGVELDDPVGKNNGTVKVCGVLCPLYARRRSLVVLSCPGCLG